MKFEKRYICLLLSLFIMNGVFAQQLQKQIESYLADKDAVVGVSVCFRGREICSINGDTRFPMYSVCKMYQAAATLDVLCQKNLSLQDTIHISKSELLTNTYSPLAQRFPNQDVDLTIEELLQYSLQLSDNNACDIIFNNFSNPESTTQFIKTLLIDSVGLQNTNIRWTEQEQHEVPNRCYDNYTTPLDAAKFINNIATMPSFKSDYCDSLLNWLTETLINCQTGGNRLPRYIKNPNVGIGHKTGTGPMENDICKGINDIGFVTLLDKNLTYGIAVFCENKSLQYQDLEDIIAQISLIVYNHMRELRIKN